MPFAEPSAEAKKWPCGKGPWPLLIGTRASLYDNGITTATRIIHYGLPEIFRNFAVSFQLLFDACKLKLEGKDCWPVSSILIDDIDLTGIKNRELSQYLIQHFAALTSPAASEIEDSSSEASSTQPKEATGSHGICMNWMVMGSKCKSKCSKRHEVIEKDLPNKQYSTKGQIRYRILETRSPVHHIVRVIAYRQDAQHKWASQMVALQKKMEKAYAKPKVPVPSFRINEVGVVMHDGRPHRVQLLAVDDDQMEVTVKMIDSKGEMVFQKKDIQYLPLEFRSLFEYTMLIGGLIPCSNHKKFHTWSTEAVRQMLMVDPHNDNLYYESDVLLHLNGIIIVNDIKMVFSNAGTAAQHQEHVYFRKCLLNAHAEDDFHGLDCVMASYENIRNFHINITF